MKIAIREWLKNKKSCIALIIYFFSKIGYMILNAWIVIIISNTISNLIYLQKNLMLLGIVCLINSIFSVIISVSRHLAMTINFTDIINRYVDKIIDSDYNMFTKFSCAHITTVLGYIRRISQIGGILVDFCLEIINVIITLLSIYIIGGSIVLPIIIVYTIGIITMKFLYKKYNILDQALNKVTKNQNQEIENIINGFTEVRSFNTEEYHRRIIRKLNKKCFNIKIKKNKINCILSMIIESTDTIGLLIVIIYTSKQLIANIITQTQAMSIVMYIFRLIYPMINILNFIDELSENLSITNEYDEIINYKNKLTHNGTIELKDFKNEICINNLSFSYESTNNTLKNINIKIKKGTKVGICGASGGGKSTLFKILNKFYIPTSGTITIDGFDINDLTEQSYRKHICSVYQENTIFPGTIRENILYGNYDISDQDLIKACHKAQLYNFIISLPNKFDTEVGPKGLKLSGGQKQRISLARLFLTNPEIILLDEATSALDNENETFIQEAIDSLNGKTIITIAHRLSTIKNCDVIYVMGNSCILEVGTHDELIAKKGMYYKMYK